MPPLTPADISVLFLSLLAVVVMMFAAYWAGRLQRLRSIEDRYEEEIANLRNGREAAGS